MFEDPADRYTATERKLASDLVTAMGYQERRPSARAVVGSILYHPLSQDSFLHYEQRSKWVDGAKQGYYK